MESYRTEEEQVEALKRWWNENGRGVVVGVVLALGVGFGWQAWQKSREQAQANASTLYQQMLMALSAEESQGAEPGRELARRIKEEHGGSTYAQFAALHLARLAVNDNELTAAGEELRWVLAMAKEGSDMHAVARLRLARVMAAQGDAEQALAMLAEPSAAYLASYDIARGDILLAEGREAEALAAFRSAVAALGPDVPVPGTLSNKLQYLEAREDAAVAEAG